MKKRIITVLILLVICVPLIVIESQITRILFFVLASACCGIGGYEVVNSGYQKNKELKNYRFLVPVLSSLVGALALFATLNSTKSVDDYLGGYVYHFGVLIALMLSMLLIFGLMIFTKGSSLSSISTCFLGVIYGGLLLGYTFSLRYFSAPILNEYEIFNITGIKSFLYIYLIVASTDTFAYIFGTKFGKHKLCEDISPNKTKEGSLFGLLFGSVVGVVTLILTKMIVVNTSVGWVILIIGGLLFSAIVSIFVQIGDLVESKLKRSYEVKDFGYILPGHGGILDRFDSFIYSGVWFYIIIQIIQNIIVWSK